MAHIKWNQSQPIRGEFKVECSKSPVEAFCGQIYVSTCTAHIFVKSPAGALHPSHLPRKLLSRWSRAAWRCRRKSPLWRPWERTDRRVKGQDRWAEVPGKHCGGAETKQRAACRREARQRPAPFTLSLISHIFHRWAQWQRRHRWQRGRNGNHDDLYLPRMRS